MCCKLIRDLVPSSKVYRLYYCHYMCSCSKQISYHVDVEILLFGMLISNIILYFLLVTVFITTRLLHLRLVRVITITKGDVKIPTNEEKFNEKETSL